MRTSDEIFQRYEALRPRLPVAQQDNPASGSIASLHDVTPEIDAFVFDAFGVLNVGERPIKGAVARLSQLRQLGLKLRVVTNAASYNAKATQQKFRRLGFSFLPEEIITSRSAAFAALDDRHWGVIADNNDPLTDIPFKNSRLGNDPADYAAVEGFLFLSTANWSDHQQTMLEDTLAKDPRRVVIANADLAAPRDFSFSIEPGFWGHQIADRLGLDVEFFGKPFRGIFEIAQSTLQGISPDRIAMCGDSLHTDVLGANAMGWKSVFVTQDGLFKDLDQQRIIDQSNITPDWITPRI
ncbi:HAD-IIA family hydrolase [Sulfitobacter donghicola]|uniref:Haloacid dehalogenase n=1 Tax=Sulfitobacter donghicola DSW-25 = KCTC 12864 = JCM 14565 TaxID=1300350 RepID=A0A073IF15_9RHOB|nr:HAD hydrolase-like protein [Sulfitobacter donghicola]KEJ88953.1 haloacid dehalogenase [Sulfitobacter donghicola DSW-25 = KCTC 12864 = JCM 14565]KIN67500.1 Haloacid dehalogenase domain protein hydrolase [Sulfitobacter donghicola DSW-25 = KCTC 12864 = JCM 14565]